MHVNKKAPDAALDAASFVDLPIPLLSRILNILPDIRLLHTRAKLASLSKAFTSAVKQQQSISVSSSELIGLSDTFTVATQANLVPTFQHITNLELQGVDSSNHTRMLTIVCHCPLLKVLHMQLTTERCVDDHFQAATEAATSLLTRLWQLMDGKPGLTQLQRITFDAQYCCGLHLESSKGTLSQQNSLACVTAGSLQLLRALAHFATGRPANEQPLSAETDRTMVSMMPELELVEMYGGVSPLLVPFHGTLRGVLTRQTEDNFRQAAVGHCAANDLWHWWNEGHPPFESMKVWTGSVTLSVLSMISTIAPNLEVLDVYVRNKAKFHWGYLCTLTSAMRSVHVVSKQRAGEDTGSLALQGLPSDKLTRLRVECADLAGQSWHPDLFQQASYLV
ncbi:hypothetical protein WJX77_011376 [Trebouxia sp. C0004]